MEEKILQKTIKIDYICDICNIGYMRPTSINNPNFPNEYQHICNNIKCNHIQNFFETNYPYIMYESKLNHDKEKGIKEDLKNRINNLTHRMQQAIETKQYDIASKLRNEQKDFEKQLINLNLY